MKKSRQYISLITLLFCTINVFATITSNSTETAIPQPDATIIIKYDESQNKLLFQSKNAEKYYIKKNSEENYTIFLTDSIRTIFLEARIEGSDQDTNTIAKKFHEHRVLLIPNDNIDITSSVNPDPDKDPQGHQIAYTNNDNYRTDFIKFKATNQDISCDFKYKANDNSIINVTFTRIVPSTLYFRNDIYETSTEKSIYNTNKILEELKDSTIRVRSKINKVRPEIYIDQGTAKDQYAIYKVEYYINDSIIEKPTDWSFLDKNNDFKREIIVPDHLSGIIKITLSVTQLTNRGLVTKNHTITIEKKETDYTWIIVSGTVLCFLILCFVVVKYLIRYGYIHTTKGTRGQTTEGTEDITGQEPMPQNTPTTEVNDRTTDEKKGITEQEPEPQNTQTTEVNEQQELFNEIKQLATDLGIFIPDTTMSIDIVRLIRKNENETQNKLNKLSNDNGKYQDTLSELKKNIQSYSNDIRVKFEDTDDIVRQTERILRQLKAINSTIDDEIKKNSFELSHSRTGNERLKSVFNEIEKGREILLREQDGKLEELETTHKEEIAKIHQDYKQHDELKDSIINELIKNISDTLLFVMKKLEKILSIATQLRYETSDDSILFDTFRFIPDNIKKIIDEINEIEVTVHNITKEEMLHIPNIVTNKLYEIVEQNIGDNQWIDKTLRLYAFSFTPEINTDFSRRGLDRTLLGDISTNIIALLGRLGVTVNIPQLFTTYNPDVQIQRNDESYLRRYCKLDSIQERIRTLPQGAICDILHIGYTYSKDGEQHTVKAIINYIF